MALLKTCPTCGFGNVPTSPFCSKCGVSLVGIAPSEPVGATPVEGGPQSQTVNSRKNVCPDCNGENSAGAERCVYCDWALNSIECEAEPCQIELNWPWGKERLTETLRIGREPPAQE